MDESKSIPRQIDHGQLEQLIKDKQWPTKVGNKPNGKWTIPAANGKTRHGSVSTDRVCPLKTCGICSLKAFLLILNPIIHSPHIPRRKQPCGSPQNRARRTNLFGWKFLRLALRCSSNRVQSDRSPPETNPFGKTEWNWLTEQIVINFEGNPAGETSWNGSLNVWIHFQVSVCHIFSVLSADCVARNRPTGSQDSPFTPASWPPSNCFNVATFSGNFNAFQTIL